MGDERWNIRGFRDSALSTRHDNAIVENDFDERVFNRMNAKGKAAEEDNEINHQVSPRDLQFSVRAPPTHPPSAPPTSVPPIVPTMYSPMPEASNVPTSSPTVAPTTYEPTITRSPTHEPTHEDDKDLDLDLDLDPDVDTDKVDDEIDDVQDTIDDIKDGLDKISDRIDDIGDDTDKDRKRTKDIKKTTRCNNDISVDVKKTGRKNLKNTHGINEKALANQEIGIESQDNLIQAVNDAQKLIVETKIIHAEIVKNHRECLCGQVAEDDVGDVSRRVQFFDIGGALDDINDNLDDVKDALDDTKDPIKDISNDVGDERDDQKDIKKTTRDTNDRSDVIKVIYADILASTLDVNNISRQNQEIVSSSLDELDQAVNELKWIVLVAALIKQEIEEDLMQCICDDEGTDPPIISLPPSVASPTTEATSMPGLSRPSSAAALPTDSTSELTTAPATRKLQAVEDINGIIGDGFNDINDNLDDIQDSVDDNNDRLKDVKKDTKKDKDESKTIDKITLDNKDKLRGLDDDVGVNRKEILKVEALMVKSLKLGNEYQANVIELVSGFTQLENITKSIKTDDPCGVSAADTPLGPEDGADDTPLGSEGKATAWTAKYAKHIAQRREVTKYIKEFIDKALGRPSTRKLQIDRLNDVGDDIDNINDSIDDNNDDLDDIKKDTKKDKDDTRDNKKKTLDTNGLVKDIGKDGNKNKLLMLKVNKIVLANKVISLSNRARIVSLVNLIDELSNLSKDLQVNLSENRIDCA